MSRHGAIIIGELWLPLYCDKLDCVGEALTRDLPDAGLVRAAVAYLSVQEALQKEGRV